MGDTKTHTGGRFVDLPEAIMEELHIWLRVREARDGKPAAKSWLFPNEDGEVTRYTHRNWAGRPWRNALERASRLASADSAERLMKATPYVLRHSCVSVEARAAGADLDWARLADRMGHSADTLRTNYLHVVRSHGRRKRMSVAAQIDDARGASGSRDAASALHERLLADEPKRAKIIDLQAKRQHRRAV